MADMLICTSIPLFCPRFSPSVYCARFRDFLAATDKVFESALVDTSPSAAPVIAYCNGGVASTVALFLLFQLRQLGVATEGYGTGDGLWANYDGSWNEWGNDDSAAVETKS